MAPITGSSLLQHHGSQAQAVAVPELGWPQRPHEPMFHDQPIPGYNPAPPKNAILTVMAVFSFFGLCFLAVAGWIKLVERLTSDQYYPEDERMSINSVHKNGFQEWLRRRGPAFGRRPLKPWRRPTDTKFWREHERPGFKSDLAASTSLLNSSKNPARIYNTFSRTGTAPPQPPYQQWFPGKYCSSPEDSSDIADFPISNSWKSARSGYSPRTTGIPNPPRGPMRTPPTSRKSTDRVTASRVLNTKRSEFKRSLSLPSKPGKAEWYGRRDTRRKLNGSDGEDEGSKRNKRPSRRFSGLGRRGDTGKGGLAVVVEEAGTTPERA